ncbi:MAG: hypothetical protein HY650_13050 [Acidobacteria bacterium]|nr:hypothetical protein [Acidobacteriota bacterium]
MTHQQPHPIPPGQPAPPPDRLAEMQGQHPQPTVPRAEIGPSRRQNPAPPVQVATFVLTPGLGRDMSETRKLIIPGNVQVRLRLYLDDGDYQSYRAMLRTSEGDAIWNQDSLRPKSTKSGRAITIRLPASLFTSRDYTIRLSGVTGEGEVEEVSSYYFRAEKR